MRPPKRERGTAQRCLFPCRKQFPKSRLFQAVFGNLLIWRYKLCLSFPPAGAVFYFVFADSSTATATATVAPTIGLFPMPMNPIMAT